jgi:hypothetical protein
MELTIKPNVKKVLVWIAMNLLVVVICIVGALVLLRSLDISSMSQVLADAGIKMDASSMLSGLTANLIIGFVLAACLLFAIVYFSFGRKKYVMSEDSLIADGRAIKYDNLARVNYMVEGLSSKLLNKGSIVFELTGLDKRMVKIDYVDRPKEVTEAIHRIVNDYRMKMYAAFADQQRLHKIVEHF